MLSYQPTDDTDRLPSAVNSMTDSHLPVGELALSADAPVELDTTELTTSLDTSSPEEIDSLTPVASTSSAEPHPFAQLGLAPELVAAVVDLGFTAPTPVQAQAIPLALPQAEGVDGHIDLMVSSQTGSGKTAAFLLPLLHTLLQQRQARVEVEAQEWARKVAEAAAAGLPTPRRPKRKDPTHPRNFKPCVPGALVLCPTRELAQQVAHDAIDLVRHAKGLRVAHVVGGMPYAVQIARLQNADLVVATPGRLLDLQRSGQIQLQQVQFLVLDEADRMLDLGFSEDLAEVNQLTVERHQTMMFSATFAPRIQQLATRVMRTPQRVQIDSPQEKHANIRQTLFWADNRDHKRRLLDHWLREPSIEQAIVFASTQIECDALAQDLQQAGFAAVALHGALSQALRNRRLMALRNGQVQILVATDVAARGIDVPSITHVFNYGLPMKSEDYVHRIGRTGRAGRDGLAVTLAEFRDQRKIQGIEAYTRQPLNTEVIPGLEPTQRLQPARKPQDRRGGGRGRSDQRSNPGWGSGWGQERHGSGRGDSGKPRGEGFARQSEGFQKRDDGFQRRDDGFQRREDGFQRRDDGFGRRNEGFGHKTEGFKRKGEGAPRFGETAGRAPGKNAERRGPNQIRSNGKPAGGPRAAFKPRAR
jgi:superfamily II DNA/RNA helicase